MGQTYLKRTHFKARETVTPAQNSAQQKMARTCFFRINDVVDVVDVDVNGNITSVLADNLVIVSLVPDQEVQLSAIVDTTAAIGTPMIVNQTIDDGQAAMTRALCPPTGGIVPPTPVGFNLQQAIIDKGVNEPIAGKTTYDIDDASFWRAGDLTDVWDNTGLILADAVIDSVNVLADATNNTATIVINAVQDVTLGNSPYLLNKTITGQKAILRNQERIDEIDRPTKNDYFGVGDGACTVFPATNLFVKDTTDIYMDGRKQTLGLSGTRATLTQDTGNAQLVFSSLILGILGNQVEVQVQAGAGLTVAVTKIFKVTGSGTNFTASQYLVQVNDNGGAATAQDLADAINAHAAASRIIQVQYGGDGTGVTAPFAAVNLAGGLDDGTGDYAEMEQIFENNIVSTGYKFASFHIRPNERNRLPEPPADDEDIIFEYATAADNVDR